MKTYVGLAGRTLIPRISVAARAGKLLIFTFPGTYRKPTPWLGEKRRFCYFHLLKGINIGEKRGESYVGPFRGFLIKPVIGESLFLGPLQKYSENVFPYSCISEQILSIFYYFPTKFKFS